MIDEGSRLWLERVIELFFIRDTGDERRLYIGEAVMMIMSNRLPEEVEVSCPSCKIGFGASQLINVDLSPRLGRG